ncbi:MAG: hypothetical protein LDL37_08840, partial [Asticcacaulis sp.]|uniref:hypothetical protein n=1 Tax=Asticcacaulis sp. TaxID=1872648 RepID=UPI0025BB8B44
METPLSGYVHSVAQPGGIATKTGANVLALVFTGAEGHLQFLALMFWAVAFGYYAWNLFCAVTRKEAKVGFQIRPFGKYRSELYKKDSDEGLAYWIATTMYAFGTIATAIVTLLF